MERSKVYRETQDENYEHSLPWANAHQSNRRWMSDVLLQNVQETVSASNATVMAYRNVPHIQISAQPAEMVPEFRCNISVFVVKLRPQTVGNESIAWRTPEFVPGYEDGSQKLDPELRQ